MEPWSPQVTRTGSNRSKYYESHCSLPSPVPGWFFRCPSLAFHIYGRKYRGQSVKGAWGNLGKGRRAAPCAGSGSGLKPPYRSQHDLPSQFSVTYPLCWHLCPQVMLLSVDTRPDKSPVVAFYSYVHRKFELVWPQCLSRLRWPEQ